jgi:hypothetical protein
MAQKPPKLPFGEYRVGRPKTSQHWILRIWTLAAQRVSSANILARFEAEADQGGRTDFPLKRTIEREVKRFHAMTPEGKRQFALFRWPDSMLDEALPWEASGDALDLLRHFDEQHWEERPTVRAALWYWRVKQARPEMALRDALEIAANLSAYELTRADARGDPFDAGADELKLTYQPWRSPDDAAAYTARTGENPIAMMRDYTDPRVYEEVMEASSGLAAAGRMQRRRARHTASTTKEEQHQDE